MKRAFVLGTAMITAVALGAAAQAEAKPFGGQSVMVFADLDQDKDGKITKEEFAARGEARFKAADADGNGELSLEEMQAAAAKRSATRAEEMLKTLDTDGNGTLSQAEMDAAKGGKREGKMGDRFISKLDTDGDGAVSEAEFAAMKDKMSKKRGWGMKKHGCDD